MSANKEFKAQRVTAGYTQKIMSDPATIFPLLCPEMEKLWLYGWDYKMIWSESSKAEKDCVFTTTTENENDTVWVNSIRDEDNLVVEFVMTTSKVRVTTLNIKIYPQNDFSKVEITYISTALSEEGNHFLKKFFSKELFDSRMNWWEKSMNHYILNGEMLIETP